MKRRNSIGKSEWNDKREKWYKAECLKIAFQTGFELTEKDQKVYKVVSDDDAAGVSTFQLAKLHT
jgi:hypothetical protein